MGFVLKRSHAWLMVLAVLGASHCAKGTEPDPDRVLKGRPDLTVSAADLQREYAADRLGANRKYEGRILEVSGTVKSVTDGVKVEPLVVFEPGGQGLVQATFHVSVVASIPASIHEKQSLRLWCEGGGSFGNVLLKDCVVK